VVEAAGVLLVVVGVFTALVLWLGVDGGGLGRRIEHGLRVAVGRLAIAVPVVLVVAGAALLGTALRRIPRRLVAGCVLLGLAALLLIADAATSGPAASAAGGWLGGTLHGLVAGIAGQVGVVLLAVVIAVAAAAPAHGWSVGTAAGGVERAVRWLVALVRRGAPTVRAVVGAARRGARSAGRGSRRCSRHGSPRTTGRTKTRTRRPEPRGGTRRRRTRPGPGMTTAGAAAPPFDGGTIFPELFVREPAVAAPVPSGSAVGGR
jgi:hypothetical protein